mgnify:CR=1
GPIERIQNLFESVSLTDFVSPPIVSYGPIERIQNLFESVSLTDF